MLEVARSLAEKAGEAKNGADALDFAHAAATLAHAVAALAAQGVHPGK